MNKLILLLILILVNSCSREEHLINNYTEEWNFLIAVDNPMPALMLVNLPSGTIISSDVISANNPDTLTAPIRNLYEFKDMIYAVIPDEYKILVLNRLTYKIVSTIDFADTQSKPINMCFPNATDAYIVHENTDKVSLLDITAFKVARTIPVGRHPVSITCSGNQVYVINQADNSVSIIDTRTHQVESVVPVSPYPVYSDATYDGKSIIIVSLGNGKLDTGGVKSAAVVSMINVATGQVTKTKELGLPNISAIDQYPRGLAVGGTSGWAFIPTSDNLFRYESKVGDKVVFVEKNNYLSAAYSLKHDKIIFLKKNENSFDAVLADPVSGKATNAFSLPGEILSVLLIQ